MSHDKDALSCASGRMQFTGIRWAFEHILESEYFQELPELIPKDKFKKTLRDSLKAIQADYAEAGAWPWMPLNPPEDPLTERRSDYD